MENSLEIIVKKSYYFLTILVYMGKVKEGVCIPQFLITLQTITECLECARW